MKMVKTIRLSVEDFGYWSSSGIGLFWMLPNVSFIKIHDDTALNDDCLTIDNRASKKKSMLSEENYLRAVNQGFSKIFLPIFDMSPPIASTQLLEDLISLVAWHAKPRSNVNGKCRITGIDAEVIIAVNSQPKLYQSTYLGCLESDERLSKYSPVRPFNTLPE